jgi:opacity protein-like surface antigen
MKSLIILAGLFLSTVAVAADIPSRNAPLPPVRPVFVETVKPFFVGVHAGTTNYDQKFWSDNTEFRANVRAGYELSPYARIEANYDYGHNSVSEFRTNTVTGNLIGQYRFGSIVPYALVGGGYRWSGIKNEPVYNVGGGVRYDLTSRFEVDARYRYVANFDNRRDENVVTLGVNYKF